MAKNRIEFEGLAEFRELLRKLPYELRDAAAAIIEGTGRDAVNTIKAAYPEGSGLAAGMTLATGTADRGESVGKGVNFGAYAIVKNRAKHASIFENGSEVRHVLRKPGGRAGNFGLSRGRMPPGRVFVPVVIRKRRAMNERLKILLRDNGFQVT